MNSLKYIREFICYNQKQIIQYEYLLSEEHKKLREYLDRDKKNTEELDSLLQNIIDVAYGGLIDILSYNSKLVYDLYKSIGINDEIRITIKTLESGKTIDFFRSHTLATLTYGKIEGDTAYKSIMSSEDIKCFISNNLEKMFLEKQYINPRLKEDHRKKLEKNLLTWEECWMPIEKDGPIMASRSILIVPMSVRITEEDSLEFKNQFLVKANDEEINQRAIWGFLSINSETSNIFTNKEKEAENIGYIIADIFSLYLMFFYNHTSGSNTFKKAIELIENN